MGGNRWTTGAARRYRVVFVSAVVQVQRSRVVTWRTDKYKGALCGQIRISASNAGKCRLTMCRWREQKMRRRSARDDNHEVGGAAAQASAVVLKGGRRKGEREEGSSKSSKSLGGAVIRLSRDRAVPWDA